MHGSKREDLPFEATMALVEQFKKLHPDKEIVFAGDLGEELPDRIKEARYKFDAVILKSMLNGSCWGCGEVMPGFPECMQEQGPLPDGWGIIEFIGDNSERFAFECGNCNGPDLDGAGVLSLSVDEDGNSTMTMLKEPKDLSDETSSTGEEPLPPADAAV